MPQSFINAKPLHHYDSYDFVDDNFVYILRPEASAWLAWLKGHLRNQLMVYNSGHKALNGKFRKPVGMLKLPHEQISQIRDQLQYLRIVSTETWYITQYTYDYQFKLGIK